MFKLDDEIDRCSTLATLTTLPLAEIRFNLIGQSIFEILHCYMKHHLSNSRFIHDEKDIPDWFPERSEFCNKD